MVIKSKHFLPALILLVLLIGGGILLYLHLRPTDENRIRALCSTFTEEISKRTKEGAIPAAAKAKKISALFTEQSSFSIDGLPWASAPRSREKLSGEIFRSRAMFQKITLGHSGGGYLFLVVLYVFELAAVVVSSPEAVGV